MNANITAIRLFSLCSAFFTLACAPAFTIPQTGVLSFTMGRADETDDQRTARYLKIANSGRTTVTDTEKQRLITLLLYLGLTTSKPPIASSQDQNLVEKIGQQVKANQVVKLSDLSELYHLRMKDKHYIAALSCLSFITYIRTLSAADHGVSTIDASEIAKTRNLAGHELLEISRTEIKTFDPNALVHLKLAKALLQSSGDAKLVAGIDNDIAELVENGQKPRGYSGFLMVGDVVESTIQYSPAYFAKNIREGDRVVSVDGVATSGLASERMRRLLDGTESSVAKIVIERNGRLIATTFKRGIPLPEKLPEDLSAREYLQLASQLREVCRFEEGRLALEKAQALDHGEIASLAKKMLAARFPKQEPTKQALKLYSAGYWLNQDNRPEAERILKQCIVAWPDFELPYRQLAVIYRASGRLSESQVVLEKLLKLNPDYARAWCDLSQLKQEKTDYSGAVADARHAMELDPDDAIISKWWHQLTNDKLKKQ